MRLLRPFVLPSSMLQHINLDYAAWFCGGFLFGAGLVRSWGLFPRGAWGCARLFFLVLFFLSSVFQNSPQRRLHQELRLFPFLLIAQSIFHVYQRRRFCLTAPKCFDVPFSPCGTRDSCQVLFCHTVCFFCKFIFFYY